jgi:ribosome-binding factor A
MTNRIERTNADIQRTLSALLRNIKDPRVTQGLISVTGVDVTGDLKYCKVFLSVLNLQSEKEFMKGLRSATGFLRRELARSLSLRNTPELVFTLDHSIEHGAHINQVISELHIQPESPDEPESSDEAAE